MKPNRVMILAAPTAAFALAGCLSSELKKVDEAHHRALESYASQMKACDSDPRPWGTTEQCKEHAEHFLAFHEQMMRDGFDALREDRLIDALENRGR